MQVDFEFLVKSEWKITEKMKSIDREILYLTLVAAGFKFSDGVLNYYYLKDYPQLLHDRWSERIIHCTSHYQSRYIVTYKQVLEVLREHIKKQEHENINEGSESL